MNLLQDLRFAARTLRRTPTFTLVAAVTLALGIGANTAIFSVFYGVLVRPLSYPDADRLVQFAEETPGYSGSLAVTYTQYRFLAERSTALATAATTSVGFNLTNGSEAFRAAGLRVSSNYFEVLGVSPVLGRGFVAEEDQGGGANAVVLSHGLWQRQFGGDPGIVGRTVALDGAPYTVVGVMPAGFRSFPSVEAWSTLAQVQQTIGSGQNLELVARLKDGMSMAAAQQQVSAALAAYRDEFRRQLPKEVRLDLKPYRQLIVSDVSRPIRILVGAIACVLLIACANVASLLLSRGIARSREMAVRLALGAGQGALVRQLLLESIVLAVLGGVLGLLVAVWGLQGLLHFVPSDVPLTDGIRLDAKVLGFAAGLSLLTGLVFGLLPAWQIVRVDPQRALKEGASRSATGREHGGLRDKLVIAEIALSLVLLTGAGLLGRTFANLMSTDAGFDVHRVTSAEIWLTGSRHEQESSPTVFYEELVERLRQTPGIEAAAIVEAGAPLARGGNMPVSYDGKVSSIDYRTITPGYFDVLGVPVLEGRGIAATDGAAGEPVVVVNQTYAKQYLAERGALGQELRIGGDGGGTYRVVGVVKDVRSFIGFAPRPTVFIASAQTPPAFTRIFSSWFPIHVMVRTTGAGVASGAAITRAIRETDPLVPIGAIEPMSQTLATSVAFQRFLLFLLGGFAMLAVVLAAVGIYGLMSHRVEQRRHEFGIRMSLGAIPRDVLELVLGRGMRVSAIGIGLGLAGAAGLTRLLESQLFGVKALDLATFTAGAAGVALVSLGACVIPALRATRVDPAVVLRDE
ncbi:MAG TPA: ABC transporter permease [Gemmatimonadales bacterium]|nr:ABC transporter permease [Gemmatimonadales bacterium]